MAYSSAIDEVFRDDLNAAFSTRPVPRELVEEILDVARRAPSGVNTQPWHVFVLQGRSLASLSQDAAIVVAGRASDAAARSAFREQFNRHPGTGNWPAQDPREAGDRWLGAALDAADSNPATDELARYFRFFDAPVGLLFTVSKTLGLGSLLDYGMFLQNITLAARTRGLQSCIQTGWRGLADGVLPRLGAPDDALLVAGMALGYADGAQAPAQAMAVADFVTWHR